MILINMLLKKLIKNLPKEKNKIEITGLEINSKKIKKGYIFFAIRGSKFNGEKYIKEAVKKVLPLLFVLKVVNIKVKIY